MTIEEFSRRPMGIAVRGGQMLAGFAFMSCGLAVLIQAGLGLPPWDVLTQGLSQHIDVSFGIANLIVSASVLLLWIPLRQRPGVGTIANGLSIGLLADCWLLFLNPIAGTGSRIIATAIAVMLIGVSTGMYIGAGLGPGPRDGLMTGLVAQTGRSIRLVRSLIEVSVLSAGWVLGGTVGIGTVLFAVSIGPLAHVFIPFFSRSAPVKPPATK